MGEYSKKQESTVGIKSNFEIIGITTPLTIYYTFFMIFGENVAVTF